MSQHLPIALFAFSNARQQLLTKLHREANDILGLFDHHADEIRREVLQNVSAADFAHSMSAHCERIHLLHWGGHSDGGHPVMTGDALQGERFDGQAFAELIRLLPNVKLVFINGCESADIVNRLYETGVSAVIGTTTKIHDDVAYKLARTFYNSLLLGNTLETAWAFATESIRGTHAQWLHLSTLKFEEIDTHAWFMHATDAAKQWRLIDNGTPAPASPALAPAPNFTLADIQRLDFSGCLRPTATKDVMIKLLVNKNPLLLMGQAGIGKRRMLEDIQRVGEQRLSIEFFIVDAPQITRSYERFVANLAREFGVTGTSLQAVLDAILQKTPLVLMLNEVESWLKHKDTDVKFSLDELNCCLNHAQGSLMLLATQETKIKEGKLQLRGHTSKLTMTTYNMEEGTALLTYTDLQAEIRRRWASIDGDCINYLADQCETRHNSYYVLDYVCSRLTTPNRNAITSTLKTDRP